MYNHRGDSLARLGGPNKIIHAPATLATVRGAPQRRPCAGWSREEGVLPGRMKHCREVDGVIETESESEESKSDEFLGQAFSKLRLAWAHLTQLDFFLGGGHFRPFLDYLGPFQTIS